MSACQRCVSHTRVCLPLMEYETRKEWSQSVTILVNYTEEF